MMNIDEMYEYTHNLVPMFIFHGGKKIAHTLVDRK